MDLGIDGRVALITGGGSGIGWQTACELAANGATVVLVGRDAPELDEAVARLDVPGRAHGLVCDVTDLAQLADLRRAVHEAVGPVDILVNNAGVVTGKRLLGAIMRVSSAAAMVEGRQPLVMPRMV
ncbi:MAG: SDR family NAD(P)-dependent oxidoreductase, partial [Cellulomonadaceae bacterium]